jgi:HEAT repeat protein
MTDADNPAALVEQFADASLRVVTLFQLNALGDAALPAVRDGLKHPDWHVRHWCAIFLDRGSDAETLRDLVPLLHDPEPQVRLWAVHSISCQHCKPGPHRADFARWGGNDGVCPIDVVALLIERAQNDPLVQVRKMAVIMLTDGPRDQRIPAVLEGALAREHDRRLRLHAQRGLRKYSAAKSRAR